MVPKSFLAIEAWLTDASNRKSTPKLSFDAVAKLFLNLKASKKTQKSSFQKLIIIILLLIIYSGTICSSSIGIFARYGCVFVFSEFEAGRD